METRLDTFNNSSYNPGSAVKRLFWYFFNLLFLLNPWNPFMGLKRAVLRMFGAKIGKKVVIKPRVNIKYPWFLEIGDYSWIGEGVWIDNLSKVSIGAHACVSQGALLLCGNHNYKKSSFDLITRPIIIENGAWIGANATVTGGVICKSHAILTVGSVASSNLEAYKIYQGNPAIVIRERKLEE